MMREILNRQTNHFPAIFKAYIGVLMCIYYLNLIILLNTITYSGRKLKYPCRVAGTDNALTMKSTTLSFLIFSLQYPDFSILYS